jgi:hypothetical protein
MPHACALCVCEFFREPIALDDMVREGFLSADERRALIMVRE